MNTKELPIDKRKKSDEAMRKQHIETYTSSLELVLRIFLYILTFRWIIALRRANTARKVIASVFIPVISCFLAWHLRIKQQYGYWYFKDYIWTWLILGSILFALFWFIWEDKKNNS